MVSLSATFCIWLSGLAERCAERDIRQQSVWFQICWDSEVLVIPARVWNKLNVKPVQRLQHVQDAVVCLFHCEHIGSNSASTAGSMTWSCSAKVLVGHVLALWEMTLPPENCPDSCAPLEECRTKHVRSGDKVFHRGPGCVTNLQTTLIQSVTAFRSCCKAFLSG